MLSFLFNTRSAKMFASLCLTFALLLMSPSQAVTQFEPNGPQAQKTALEITELQNDVAKLNKQADVDSYDWLELLSIFGSGIAVLISALAAYRTRQGATDLPVHEKRLAIYPDIVKITAPLAIYFQDTGGRDRVTLTPTKCSEIGYSMAKWYFEGGGILMSTQARDAYMSLAQALTRATKSKTLHAPSFPDESEYVSHKSVDDYRSLLFKEIEKDLAKIPPTKTTLQHTKEWFVLNTKFPSYREGSLKKVHASNLASPKSIKAWTFGAPPGEDPIKAAKCQQKFRDYVFLQNLSSKLRSALAADIRGRRRPE